MKFAWKKWLTGLFIVLFLLFAVLLLRTVLFGGAERPAVAPVTVPVDEARLVRNMSEAIRFRTISTGNPDTQQYQAFKDYLEWTRNTYPAVLQALSLEMVAEHTMLFTWQGSDSELKPVLLTAHYDVVPVVPGTEDDWLYPPYSGAVEDGYVWGRGAMDDKSGVLAMLEAVTLLLDQGFQPRRTVYLSFGHDEETGGEQGARGVADLLQSRGVQLAWSLDEGSFIGKGVIPGMRAPIASINVAEKGSVTLELIARGAGGHSSMPENEVALDILAKALVKLRQHPVPGGMDEITAATFDEVARHGPFALRFVMANKWLFGPLIEKFLSSNVQTNAMLRTTTAPTMLHAGVKSNVIPPSATAVVNFRLHPRDTAQSVQQHVIQAIDDDRVKVKVRNGGLASPASSVSSVDSHAFSLLQKVVLQVFGNDVIVVPGVTVAATDTKHYSRVADNSYRFQYMVVRPEEIDGFHGTNERVSVDNLVKGTGAYYLLIKQAAGSETAAAQFD